MTQFEQKMEELRARFLVRVQAEIASLWAAHHQKDYAAMRQLAHSLAGNAGIFGYPEFSARARELENALDASSPLEGIEKALHAITEEAPS